MNPTGWIRIGAFLGGIGVIAGTFGAHGLDQFVEPERIEIFKTGVTYQMYHALALIGLGLFALRVPPSTALRVAGWSFVIGAVVFPGALYLLVLAGGAADWLGMVAPIGGVAFIVGWFAFAAGCRSATDTAARPLGFASGERAERELSSGQRA